MANRRLTESELVNLANPLLQTVRAQLKELSRDDNSLLWALRRKLAKELLYDEQYTIAGAKKKLANELRGGAIREGETATAAKPAMRSLKPPPSLASRFASAPVKAETASNASPKLSANHDQKEALRAIATELREILVLLDESDRQSKATTASSRT